MSLKHHHHHRGLELSAASKSFVSKKWAFLLCIGFFCAGTLFSDRMWPEPESNVASREAASDERLLLMSEDYKVLRTYAEMENVMDRTRRDAENTKKYAIQNFAKSLLDVADNLGRASSVVKESFSKLDDTSKDSAGAAPLLKTLLEGVEMTEKQLAEVFKKFGMEKYDPINEPFDPNRHNAVFQVPDASKPEGTVAHVLKSGYTLFDRVIRPAEVGVTQGGESQEDKKESDA
ncbi:hypothetical protein F2Q68_00037473 [Brassica cretica]|uniref:GrpE protein homolog n=1 Tax=Brassica cretica TaxID=69181 RepID=A0A8S9H1B9_BRACR|nr:hypothetical protein F2Q68_00037473 [Brassica cretica]